MTCYIYNWLVNSQRMSTIGPHFSPIRSFVNQSEWSIMLNADSGKHNLLTMNVHIMVSLAIVQKLTCCRKNGSARRKVIKSMAYKNTICTNNAKYRLDCRPHWLVCVLIYEQFHLALTHVPETFTTWFRTFVKYLANKERVLSQE